MTLSSDQQERIRKNRERALAIQRERAAQQEIAKKRENGNDEDVETNQQPPSKKRFKADDRTKHPADEMSSSPKKEQSPTTNQQTSTEKQRTGEQTIVQEEPEDFEIGASEFITRQDAMKLYCLPAGTLDVCQYVERPNPRNTSWKPMRLYHRSEIRERAHRRFGGLNGLVKERQNRANKRLSVDMEKAKKLFR